ncbi:AraC family transcriptional regulator [Nocardioides silvaticus]|uniref:AraC family transcriptional regulator n=1 Tax=Nocardioides silvaticus TaxID=2201891 RepID=A0A316TPZ4_9ACTN|nr:AraC family transcriptional regulator [Nocardioides silvaticus]PWN04274.1 AraC family transcriptional regulator [Nocardioides silvaticus]
MTLSEAGVPYTAFAQLLESQALGADAVARFRAIMDREGVTEATLLQDDAQVPVRWFREVYPTLDTEHATDLGHTFAEQAQLTSFGPLSLPLISAGSVAEIMELLTYLPLITTAVTTRFHPSVDGLTVGLTGHIGDPDLDCLLVTYCGSALQRLIHMLVGDESTVKLHTSWPAPASIAQHDHPRGHLIANASMTFVHVPTETLNEVCRFSDPVAYRLAIADLRESLEHKIEPTSYSDKVRMSLDEARELKTCQTVADELSMSASTLKRRLQEEGTTFRDLLETSLLERATLRLLDRSASVSEVAIDLGYSDLTNFSHAFKRWTGQSPRQFRESCQSW